MASQGDLQELLRMFTARKVSMLAAMGHVKSLQAKNLKRLVYTLGRVQMTQS